MRVIGHCEVVSEHKLADGSVMALVHETVRDHWSIEFGLSDEVVQHKTLGIISPRSKGCMGCMEYEDKAREAYDILVTLANTKSIVAWKQADEWCSKWWRKNLELLINSPEKLAERRRLIEQGIEH